MPRLHLATLAASLSFLSLATSSQAAPVLWPVSSGGNGHYYEFVDVANITFDAAKTAANARTYLGQAGHLVIFDPANYTAEMQFVNDAVYVPHGGPYLDTYWTGASKTITANDTPSTNWFWSDGQPVPPATAATWTIDYNEGTALGTRYAAVMFGVNRYNLGDYRVDDALGLSHGYVVEYESAAIPGDYNRDGHVDAADYTVWADNFGAAGTNLAADGNNDGHVDAADYTIWADNFGRSAPLIAAVPEPTAAGLFAALPALLRRRSRG